MFAFLLILSAILALTSSAGVPLVGVDVPSLSKVIEGFNISTISGYKDVLMRFRMSDTDFEKVGQSQQSFMDYSSTYCCCNTTDGYPYYYGYGYWWWWAWWLFILLLLVPLFFAALFCTPWCGSHSYHGGQHSQHYHGHGNSWHHGHHQNRYYKNAYYPPYGV